MVMRVVYSKMHLSRATWWRYQMETFSALLALCAGNSPVTGEFPKQRPATRSFGVFFNLHRNKLLCQQKWVWWFETPSCSLWRHCNENLQHEEQAYSQDSGCHQENHCPMQNVQGLLVYFAGRYSTEALSTNHQGWHESKSRTCNSVENINFQNSK